jgi:hypothetical protein
MAFYDQLPAFIGVVVGAGMSFAATYWMDRTGWRREATSLEMVYEMATSRPVSI